MPNTKNEFSIELSGRTYAFITWGEKKNPPIFAIHNLYENATTFEKVGEIAGEKYYFIAVDLIGHGASPKPSGLNNYHPIDFVADIKEIVELLELRNYILLGHGTSGLFCEMVAALYPDYPSYIKGLILYNANHFYWLHHGRISFLDQMKNYCMFRSANLGKKKIGFSSLNKLMWSILTYRTKTKKKIMNDPTLSKILETMIKRDYFEKDEEWFSKPRVSNHSPYLLTYPQYQEVIDAIKTPVLHIASRQHLDKESDKLLNEFYQNKNQMDINLFDDEGYFHWKDPDIFFEWVDAFINKL